MIAACSSYFKLLRRPDMSGAHTGRQCKNASVLFQRSFPSEPPPDKTRLSRNPHLVDWLDGGVLKDASG